MSYGIIYKAINKINNKSYIGQTTRLFRVRKNDHISASKRNTDNFYFHNALSKYGQDNFVWSILCKCQSLEDLNIKEIYYIDKYNTYNRGYNMTKGGDGVLGYALSVEARIKISKAKTGFKYPPRTKEWCDKISKAKTGGKLSKETIEKRTATRKERGYIGPKNHLSKKYIIISPEDINFVVEGLRAFCINYKDISFYKGLNAVATGKRTHHKGYKCRYYNEELDKNIPIWEHN